MGKKITVLGVDPSMTNFGYALGNLDLETGILSDVSISLTEAPPIQGKKQVRQNSKDLERAQMQFKGLKDALNKASLVFVEIPVGSQSA